MVEGRKYLRYKGECIAHMGSSLGSPLTIQLWSSHVNHLSFSCLTYKGRVILATFCALRGSNGRMDVTVFYKLLSHRCKSSAV